jgi:exonuclease VII small subunit
MKTFDEKFERLAQIAKEIQEEGLPLERVKALRDEGVQLQKETVQYIEALKRPTE